MHLKLYQASQVYKVQVQAAMFLSEQELSRFKNLQYVAYYILLIVEKIEKVKSMSIMLKSCLQLQVLKNV